MSPTRTPEGFTRPGLRCADLVPDFAALLIMRIDAGDPITILGGVHVGCFELFGTDRVRASVT